MEEMKRNKEIEEKVERLLDELGSQTPVGPSPFFKEKALNAIFNDTRSEESVSIWFSPKLQWAALLLILIANIYVFYTMQQDAYNDKVEEFALTYELESDDEATLY